MTKRTIKEYAMITLGTGLISAAVYFFMIPANLCPGSAAALGMLLGNVIPLPVSMITLGISYGASASRLIRTSMIDVLNEDYIRTARAKGLGGIGVICKHALKNASIPIVTVLGMQLRSLFCGALIVETVFALKGLGDVCFSAIGTRDLPIIQGTVLYSAFLFVIINLLVDLLYAVLDPRIRVTGGGK